MNQLQFKLKKQATFFYGVCTEDKLTSMIADAESEGCEFLQCIAGMMMPPRSPLAVPGAQDKPIQVIKVLVRMPVDEYDKLIKSRSPAQNPGAH